MSYPHKRLEGTLERLPGSDHENPGTLEQVLEADARLEYRVQLRTTELEEANAALEREIAERRRVEDALWKERAFMEELLDLQERDRKLVAYEIHDGLAQQLAGTLMGLQACQQMQRDNPDEAQRILAKSIESLKESIAEARRLMDGLRPQILDDSGVVAAVDELVRRLRDEGGAQIEYVVDVRFDRLAPPLENAIYRIVQESLTNARRYSQSERIRVSLVQEGTRCRLEVRDWGVGFQMDQVRENRFGLRGIRERASLLGGRAEVESAPSLGTRIRVVLPLLRGLPG